MKSILLTVAFLSLCSCGSKVTFSKSNNNPESTTETQATFIGSFTDQSDASSGFAGGTKTNSEWATTHLQITSWSDSSRQIPDNAVTDGYINMTGIIGLWHLDGTVGTINTGAAINDVSGSSYHGSTLNADSSGMAYQAGPLNEAILFDGVDDYVEIPYSNEFNLYPITVMAWFKTASTSGYAPIVSKYLSSSFKGYMIHFYNGTLCAWYFADSSSNAVYDGGGSCTLNTVGYNDGNWHHVVFTVNSGGGKLFVDGNMTASRGWNGTPAASTSTELVRIGIYNGNNFLGSIDEVSIWGRDLSANEIDYIYQRQKGQYGGGNSSTFTSRIFNSNRTTTQWNSVSWVPQEPYLKELPSNGQTEVNYSTNNIDMTENRGLWRFNGTLANSVGTAADSILDVSGNDNHGTPTDSDATMTFVDGKFSQGISFDGVDDKITITDPGDMFGTGDLTISMWIKPNNVTSTQWLMKDQDPITPWAGWGIAMYSGSSWGTDCTAGELCFWTSVSIGTSANWHGVPHNFVTGKWFLVTVTFTSSSKAKTFYINGQSIGSKTGGEIIGSNGENAVIGANTSGSYFDGDMDEIAIWNRALTPNEIWSIYQRGILRLKLQVRSCDDSACDSETFIGPDGTSSTFYSELYNSTINLPTAINFSNVNTNQYFQYKLFLETNDSAYTPKLDSISINGTE